MAATVSLREVTDDNRDEVIALAVRSDQQAFVASVARSLQDAAEAPQANPWMRAIYAADEPVGFLMISDDAPRDTAAVPFRYFLWRFLIDANHQGRGYGRAALDELVAYVRTRPGADELGTSAHAEEPGAPFDFYVRYGFIATGEVISDEHILRLPLA